ncbi:response regulator transcription factor (plasmid) [Phyllobacterium sp. 628]|uniref:response regulator n=1 Tax=Phyllobacterium sp. 628 TaxID=2718938 RepID=UPI0016623641|nr:response regulator transcription factor [Phyllobacterium sp. 628]QND54556.1 response regulator transcription factor [Phyllobacterium sp. 628]
MINTLVHANENWKKLLSEQVSTNVSLAHVLVVEDDPEIAKMLVALLTGAGFAATSVISGRELDQRLGKTRFDLIILDAMLPGEDGFSICRRLRASMTIPILMLTALGEEIDRILGIELGADDYVTKPFSSRELLARVKGLLRRSSYGTQATDQTVTLAFAGWRLDLAKRQLRDPEGVEVSMTTAELDVLIVFCNNPGKVLTRKEILALTHAGTAGPVHRSIDVHISRVRQKIEPGREPTFIKTVRLGGYLFTPEVEKL